MKRPAPNPGPSPVWNAAPKVHVDYSCGNGWVAVSDYHFSGYVQVKFLVAQKPGKYEITEREDNFVSLRNPYMVSAKALNSRTERSVGLRVKPNKTSGAIRRLTAGDRLQVIAQGKTWSKVLDLQTGRTGYVANEYIQKI
ncbi:MAG: SH3 domain-containing protein [Clostridia bacterium]|nr:SH3 domain-containing protein [Clostridia bacterium]